MASRRRDRREQRTPPSWWLDEHNRLLAELAEARAQTTAVRSERDDVLDALAEATAAVQDAARQMTTLNRLAGRLTS